MANPRKEEKERDWMNVTEACAYLKVSRQTLYKLMNEGTLPYYELKNVRGRRIKIADLDALLQRGSPVEEK